MDINSDNGPETVSLEGPEQASKGKAEDVLKFRKDALELFKKNANQVILLSKNMNPICETVSSTNVEQALGKKEQQSYTKVVTDEKKLASLEDLINFKTTLANKDVDELILSDRSMSLILKNFTESCVADNIKLTSFYQLPKAEDKVNLDSNNDFIKICKFMYQMVMNKNKETMNQDNSVEFVLGGVGHYYFSNFCEWLAKIKYFEDYIANIQKINCNDADFNSFKELIQSYKLGYYTYGGETCMCFCSNSIPEADRIRINLKMLGELELKLALEFLKKNKRLLIALDIITFIGFILSAFFAINYFWLGFIEMSSAAAIASMVIPCAVGLLCLGTCIFLLMTHKSRSTEIPYKLGDIKLKSGEIVNRYGKKYPEKYPKDNIEINRYGSITMLKDEIVN